MRSPGRRFEPPPSMRLMMKVEMLGTNTMVMPVVMPGMASGTSTRVRMWNWFAPRSCAASMTLWSIFTIMVYSGRIM